MKRTRIVVYSPEGVIIASEVRETLQTPLMFAFSMRPKRFFRTKDEVGQVWESELLDDSPRVTLAMLRVKKGGGIK